MPQELRTFESGLRLVGYGPQVDEFILSMNRAAERAAPHAKRIFWDAITKMSFADARNILNGGDTAATDYFKDKTTDRLTAGFRPVVDKAMNEVGVTRQYKELVGRAPEEQASKTGLDRKRGANHISDAPRGPRDDREPGVVNFSRTGREL